MPSQDTLKAWQSMLSQGTITPETYNSMVAKSTAEAPYIAPGYTSWGAKPDAGQTVAEAEAAMYKQATTVPGYGQLEPGTSYSIGAGNQLTKIGSSGVGTAQQMPVAQQPVAQPVIQPNTGGQITPVAAMAMANASKIATPSGVANPYTPTPSGVVNPYTPTPNNYAGANFGDTAYSDWLAAQYQQGMGQLDYARNQSMANIANAQAEIQPYYYDERNRYAAQDALARRAEQERMATQGLSGVSAQGEISRNVASQGALSAIGRDEVAKLAEMERLKAEALNEYEFGRGDLMSQLLVTQAEQGIRDEATAKSDAEENEFRALAEQYFAEMVTSGNATQWLLKNGGALGPEMVDYLSNFAKMYTPEEIAQASTQSKYTETPAQIGAMDYIYNIALPRYDTVTQAVNNLNRLRTEGLPKNVTGKPAPPDTVKLYNELMKLTDNQFMSVIQDISKDLGKYQSAEQEYQAEKAQADAKASETAQIESAKQTETQITGILSVSVEPIKDLKAMLDGGYIDQTMYYKYLPTATKREQEISDNEYEQFQRDQAISKAEQERKLQELENNISLEKSKYSDLRNKKDASKTLTDNTAEINRTYGSNAGKVILAIQQYINFLYD